MGCLTYEKDTPQILTHIHKNPDLASKCQRLNLTQRDISIISTTTTKNKNKFHLYISIKRYTRLTALLSYSCFLRQGSDTNVPLNGKGELNDNIDTHIENKNYNIQLKNKKWKCQLHCWKCNDMLLWFSILYCLRKCESLLIDRTIFF